MGLKGTRGHHENGRAPSERERARGTISRGSVNTAGGGRAPSSARGPSCRSSGRRGPPGRHAGRHAGRRGARTCTHGHTNICPTPTHTLCAESTNHALHPRTQQHMSSRTRTPDTKYNTINTRVSRAHKAQEQTSHENTDETLKPNTLNILTRRCCCRSRSCSRHTRRCWPRSPHHPHRRMKTSRRWGLRRARSGSLSRACSAPA